MKSVGKQYCQAKLQRACCCSLQCFRPQQHVTSVASRPCSTPYDQHLNACRPPASPTMVKLKRNPKLRRDKPKKPLSADTSSEVDQGAGSLEASPHPAKADALGIIYLFLALVGFGASCYVLCLATPVIAVGAMLICVSFFTSKSTTPADVTIDDDGLSRATTITGP